MLSSERFSKLKNILPKFLRRRGGESEANQDRIIYIIGVVFVAIILFMIFKVINKKPNVPAVPPPAPSEQPQPPPATSGARPATPSASEKSNKKCCKTLSGEDVDKPSASECTDKYFGSNINSIEELAAVVKGATGLVLEGDGLTREINGYVSTAIGLGNQKRYVIHLYDQDALNYDYDPPYRYKSTPCIDGLKEKINKALNPPSPTPEPQNEPSPN